MMGRLQRVKRCRWVFSGFAIVALIVVTAMYVFLSLPSHVLTIVVKSGPEGAALAQLARDFSKQYAVPVRVVQLEYNELFTSELSQLLRGSGDCVDSGITNAVSHRRGPCYDVIMLDDPWFEELFLSPSGIPPHVASESSCSSEGMLYNMECFPGIDIKWRSFLESELQVTRHAGQKIGRYAVPFVGNSQLLVVRKSAAVGVDPKTWDAILDYSQSHNAKGFVARTGPGNSLVTDFVPIVWAYNDCNLAPRFDEDHCPPGDKVPFPDRQAGARSLHTFRSLVSTSAASQSTMDDFDIAAYLLRRDASIGIVWSAWAMALEGLDKERDYLFVDLPSVKDARNPSHPELGTWLLGIPWNASDPAAAAKFIEFVTAEEQIKDAASGFCGESGSRQNDDVEHHSRTFNPPPIKEVLEGLKADPKKAGCPNETSADQNERRKLFSQIENSLSTAWPRPRTYRWKEFEWRLSDYLDMALTQDVDDRRVIDAINLCLTPLLYPDPAIASVPSGCERSEILEQVRTGNHSGPVAVAGIR